jgi:hypothetical protein
MDFIQLVIVMSKMGSEHSAPLVAPMKEKSSTFTILSTQRSAHGRMILERGGKLYTFKKIDENDKYSDYRIVDLNN